MKTLIFRTIRIAIIKLSMSSSEFTRLQEEVRKGRVSQCLSSEEAQQLIQHVTVPESQELLRIILRDKSYSKRSIVDVYVLMACMTRFNYLGQILEGKGQKALQEFCRHCHYTQVGANQYLYQIGDLADKFYILMSGEVQVQVAYKQEVRNEKGQVKTETKMKEAMRFGKGQMFGESISKQKVSRRAASIFTVSDCEFFEVKKKDYESVQKYMTISLMREKYMFLQKIDLFSRLTNTDLESLLYVITTLIVPIGKKLYCEGELLSEIYIVKSGEFKLESSIKGDDVALDALSFLKTRNFNNTRKVEVSIVGSRFVLGEVDALMGNPTLQSCVCITEWAQVYVIKKKDLLEHLPQNFNIESSLAPKEILRSRRLRSLNRTFHQGHLLRLLTQQKEPFQLSCRSQERKGMTIKRSSDERNFSCYKKGFQRHQHSINSSKMCATEELGSLGYKSQIGFIDEVIRHKRRYSEIRKNNNEPLFRFSREIPVFLKVKMGLDYNSTIVRVGQESSKTLSDLPTPSKLSRTSKIHMKLSRKEHKISANSKTIYGKFFQTLLQV